MQNKLFVGIDPSLSHTGLFFIWGKQYQGLQIDSSPKDFNHSIMRCNFIAQTIISLIEQKQKQLGLQVGMICCEDYFTGRQPRAVIQLAQLGTMLRFHIMSKGFPLVVAAPKKLKKYVTSNGNAPKNLMIKTVYKRWGYDVSTDNIADASGLANFAKVVYQLHHHPQILQFKQYQKEVFKEYDTEQCLLKLD